MEFKTKKGLSFFADEQDADFINSKKWYITIGNRIPYVRAMVDGKMKFLHRLLLGISDPSLLVDHKDRNGLNNCRDNLRIATHSDNQKNKLPRGKSKFMGVFFHHASDKWIASININGKGKNLGSFKDPIDAARAYNNAAIATGNEFYRLNDIPDEIPIDPEPVSVIDKSLMLPDNWKFM